MPMERRIVKSGTPINKATKAAPIKVSQATLDKIKADGMQKALLKVGTYKGTPEYREGVKRLYGQARITAAEKSAPAQKILSAPKNVPGTKSPGGFMSQNEIKKFVEKAGGLWIIANPNFFDLMVFFQKLGVSSSTSMNTTTCDQS